MVVLTDGDEHLRLVVNEAGEVILDNGPAFCQTWTLAKPGWPWGCPLRAAIHPAQKKKPANNSREFKNFSNFLLPRLARSTLSDRVICCLLPMWGPSEQKRWLARVVCVRENGCAENDLAAVGRRRNSRCLP